jgi:hypothetical protein
VPASFANRPVSLRVYPERIVIAAERQLICEHRRIIERSHDRLGQTVYDWRHYLAVIQRKPGALRNGAPFTELPEAFKRLQQHLLRRPGGDREMVEILALVLQHDEQAVLAAVEMALEAGVPTKVHILNLLHRLVDGKPIAAPVVDAPQALNLANEPKANVERSPAAVTKQTTGRTLDGLPVHSFHTLIADLATLTRNTVEIASAPGMPFAITARPTPTQKKALDLLAIACTQ